MVSKPSDFARTLDNIGRHLAVGVELTIRNSIFLRMGYSYRQMVEMKAADRFNTSGFSFGLGITVKGFELCATTTTCRRPPTISLSQPASTAFSINNQ